MADNELLELAAKAAEIKLEFRRLLWTEGTDYPCYEDTESVCEAPRYIPVVRWNPLTDDGDALRLAVKLQLLVNTDATESQATDGKKADECELHQGSNAYAATRRAIVRAAAEIGKGMK